MSKEVEQCPSADGSSEGLFTRIHFNERRKRKRDRILKIERTSDRQKGSI